MADVLCRANLSPMLLVNGGVTVIPGMLVRECRTWQSTYTRRPV